MRALTRIEEVAQLTSARNVCAQLAEDLLPEVPYVRGWSDAKRGADALAEQLRAMGLDSEFPGLKADVNVFGDGVVRLGAVRPEAVEELARILASGLCVEMAECRTDDTDAGKKSRSSAA